LRDLGVYLYAIATDWISWVAGGAGLIVTILQYLYADKSFAWLICAIAGVCGLVVPFRIWRRTHKLVQQPVDTRAIGKQLATLHTEGLALRREIVNSDDSTDPDVCIGQANAWLQRLADYASANVSPAKATYIISQRAVLHMVVAGMKSDKTRARKEDLVLQIGATLDRVAEIMREY
jgi:hypothetical protein